MVKSIVPLVVAVTLCVSCASDTETTTAPPEVATPSTLEPAASSIQPDALALIADLESFRNLVETEVLDDLPIGLAIVAEVDPEASGIRIRTNSLERAEPYVAEIDALGQFAVVETVLDTTLGADDGLIGESGELITPGY